MNSQPQENLQGIRVYSFLDDENAVGSLAHKKPGEDIAGMPVASSVAGALLSTN